MAVEESQRIPTTITRSDTGESLTLTATIKRGHTQKSMITRHPAEQGVNFADHIRPEPAALSLEGFVSNIEPRGKPGDVEAAWAFFQGIRNKPTLVSVTTRLQNYTSMAMGNIVVPEEANLGSAMTVTAEISEFVLKNIKKSIRNLKLGAPAKKGKAAEEKKDPPPKQTFADRALNKIDAATGGAVSGWLRNMTR